MRLDELDFDLPERLIAQHPIEPRDASRLMVVDRASSTIAHRTFRDILTLLDAGDLLVVNDSRVLPARLHGHKQPTGGHVEALLLRDEGDGAWQALLRPGRRLREGQELVFGALRATCEARHDDGVWTLRFDPADALRPYLHQVGETPLPPYIHARLEDPERYQTVYAQQEGSAAAPTAGLHFTPRLLEELAARGVGQAAVTLHVGLDTFRPVQTARVEDHPMHTEAWVVPNTTATAIAEANTAGRRVIAVGTTSVRALETSGGLAGAGWTRLFITPGYRFQVVDAMLTNFHLPRTTLFALVSTLAGQDLLRRAYAEAIAQEYRLLSFGDAMLIL
jgi:S-adenosylmethionine:tRNA ribosyltransferase-isomerase